MQTQYIQSFLMIHKHRSFSKAAKSLYITQPALTQQINRLESELGFLLFNRDKSQGLSLTPQGECFLKYAVEVNDLLNEAISECQKIGANKDKIITLGYAIQHANCLDPAFYSFITQKFPAVSFQMVLESSNNTLQLLSHDEVDVFIIKDCMDQLEDYDYYPFKHTPYVFMMSKDHPYANKDKIRVDELMNINISFQVKGISTSYDNLVEQLLQNNPFIHEVAPYEQISELKDVDSTCLYLTTLDQHKYCPELTCIEFDSPIHSPLGFAIRKDTTQQVREFIQEALFYYQS